MSCTAGVENDNSQDTPSDNVYGSTDSIQIIPAGPNNGSGVFETNVSGVGIRFDVNFAQGETYCTQCKSSTRLWNQNGESAGEQIINPYMYIQMSHFIQNIAGTPDIYRFGSLGEVIRGEFSIKATLIKTGPISYDSNISLSNSFGMIYSIAGKAVTDSLFGGGGIKIIAPACQLQTKDYKVDMPTWENNDPKGTVIVGNPEPVNLELECSGKVANVRFKFEDAGANKLSSKNISLYESIGGGVNAINGLEIEMLYNGVHVDVDNTSTTNIGDQGVSLTKPDSIPVYNSSSIVKFSARYIQRNNITAQYGNRYAGPVTGKVNMWVTYD